MTGATILVFRFFSHMPEWSWFVAWSSGDVGFGAIAALKDLKTTQATDGHQLRKNAKAMVIHIAEKVAPTFTTKVIINCCSLVIVTYT